MTDLSGNLLAQGGPWWECPSFLRFESHGGSLGCQIFEQF